MTGRTKGGLNTKLHAVTDTKGRPLRFFMTAGQVSDHTGAAALLGSLPAAEWLIADRGYDADWFRDALKGKGISPCIPSRTSRAKAVRYDCGATRPQSYRDHVRQVEGLANRRENSPPDCFLILLIHRHPLRQVPEGLPLRRRPRRNPHVLALKFNEAGA